MPWQQIVAADFFTVELWIRQDCSGLWSVFGEAKANQTERAFAARGRAMALSAVKSKKRPLELQTALEGTFLKC